jgi:hypothetical protein
MHGHLVLLAAFFMESQPPTRAIVIVIIDVLQASSETTTFGCVSLQIILRIFLHAIWRMDAAATTGSRELVPIKSRSKQLNRFLRLMIRLYPSEQ